jgi:cell division protein FtsI (penicillin-binding protein 3)
MSFEQRRSSRGRAAIPNQKLRTVSRWRRLTVLALLGLGATAVSARAFYLQVVENDFLAHEGNKRHVGTIEFPGYRGAIRDRRGEPLALSAPVESIGVEPKALLAAPEYLSAVAGMLGRSPKALKGELERRQSRQFFYLERQMSPEAAKQVLALNAPGISMRPEYRRFYPAGEVAAQLVGFTSLEGKGQEGIEAAQDAVLTGKPGLQRVIRDAKRRVVEDTEEAKPAQPGQDVELTIDLRLQYLAYRELKNSVQQFDAKGGIIVVADVATGEILAMASQPGYNPNNPEERKGGALRNRAITDSFEPGSTVKPLLMAQALELGAFHPQDHIDTGPGWWKVGSLTVRDVHPHGDMDLAMILTKSSNVGAAKIGLQIGAQAVWDGYQKFGFGDPAHSGFPGEASPVLRPYSEWGQIATATASYGYGMSMTALHLVRAYAALANDGLMPQIHLLKNAPAVPPQRAVSAATARQVRELMQGVVSAEGTARRAAIPGYRIAGKTGTVHKVSAAGGYAEKSYQSAFIGMVPADHPRLVGLVLIDEPGASAYYGGLVAAPAFSTVMQGALRLLQIPPDEPTAPALHTAMTSPAVGTERLAQ